MLILALKYYARAEGCFSTVADECLLPRAERYVTDGGWRAIEEEGKRRRQKADAAYTVRTYNVRFM